MAAAVAVPAVVRAVAAALAMTVVEEVATMVAPVHHKEVLCKATSKSLIHQKQQSNRPF